LKAQPDADKTLSLILSRLEDMKAEETVTIDLRGKSAYSDYMIVTTGRANRRKTSRRASRKTASRASMSRACPIATGC